jgi:hypothetical protein
MEARGSGVPVSHRLVVAAVAAVAAVTGVGVVSAARAAPSIGAAPFVTDLVDTGAVVRVRFKDRSRAEDEFVLFRRAPTGTWQVAAEVPTRNKPGGGYQADLVDPSPNALRCYIVAAADNLGAFPLAWSREECVGGGGDPFDTSLVGIAAPRVTSVRREPGSATGVRVTYVDRSVNESRFKLFRRQGGNLDLLVESVPASRTGVGRSQAFFDTVPAGADACYSVQGLDDVTSFTNLSNEVCLTPPAPLPAPRTGRGSINPAFDGTVDLEGSGADAAMAVGADGLPIVAFRVNNAAQTDPRLMVSHCDDPACGSWTATRLDGDGGYPSIAIGRDGLAVIAYLAEGRVSVAHCSNRTCTSATLATADRVTDAAGGEPVVGIGSDGLPTVVYEDGGRRAEGVTVVKAAHCRDAACGAFTVTAVGTVRSNSGGHQRLAIATAPATGRTYVAFDDGHNRPGPGPRGVLRMTTCLDPACTSRTTHAIDSGASGLGDPGSGMSMAIGRDGLPLLSYDKDTGVVVAHCVNVLCTGTTTEFHDDGRLVHHTSAAVGADGLPVVAYNNGGRIKILHCADLTCDAAATHTLPTGEFPGTPAIAIGADGLPVVAYNKVSPQLAHCPDAACSPF